MNFQILCFLIVTSTSLIYTEDLHNLNQEYERLIEDLANYETSGYKASYDNFFQNGSLKRTGVTLDLALSGEGYFKVTENDISYYTRNSYFLLDVNKNIVRIDGKLLISLSQYSNTVDWNTLDINTSGDITAKNLLENKKIQIGKINIYDIIKSDKISSIYFSSKTDPTLNLRTHIQSGFVELSKVDTNILEVMIVNKLYEMNNEIGEIEFNRLLSLQKILFQQLRSLKENEHISYDVFQLLKINKNIHLTKAST